MKKLILSVLSVLLTASTAFGYLLQNDENGNPYGVYKNNIVAGYVTTTAGTDITRTVKNYADWSTNSQGARQVGTWTDSAINSRNATILNLADVAALTLNGFALYTDFGGTAIIRGVAVQTGANFGIPVITMAGTDWAGGGMASSPSTTYGYGSYRYPMNIQVDSMGNTGFGESAIPYETNLRAGEVPTGVSTALSCSTLFPITRLFTFSSITDQTGAFLNNEAILQATKYQATADILANTTTGQAYLNGVAGFHLGTLGGTGNPKIFKGVAIADESGEQTGISDNPLINKNASGELAPKVQNGNWYMWSAVDIDVDIASPKYFSFSINAGDTLNARVIITTSGSALIEVYESAVIGGAGTGIADWNKNRHMGDSATTVVEQDCNTTTAGTVIIQKDASVSGKYLITGYVDEPKISFAGALTYVVKITVLNDDTRVGLDLSGIEEQ